MAIFASHHMALLDHVSLRSVSCPQSFHFTSENNVFVTILPVRGPSFRKGYHHSTVKCLKGEIKLPIPLKDKQNGHDCKPSTISGPQVVKRKDFPFDFMFGASTSALQVSLSLYTCMHASSMHINILMFVYVHVHV